MASTVAITEPTASALPNYGKLRQPGTLSLVEVLLAEQQDLSAVERFAQVHDAGEAPSQAKYYRSLLPASPPGPGEQYAFEVDLDRCSGCKACVTACHNLNGLDDRETWRDVGLLHGGTPELPIVQHATTACHHCLEPACMSACPVGAYEKSSITGIVKHLDDQCIGCQYCVFACPYDVPKYNARLGIVRKCDMCSERLAVGEAPACVQACPHEAIRITLASQHDVVANCETSTFLPGAPESTITFPTTNYRTDRPLARNLLPADYYAVKREHAHWPLIVMLVLTQLSVGAFLAELVLRLVQTTQALATVRPVHSAGALAFGLIALGASVFHLGRPRYAFRAFLGLRTSWLSREILAFTLFAAAAFVYSASTWLLPGVADPIESALGWAVVAFGLSGVLCSVMVYVVTRRAYWNAVATTLKFLLTTLLLGAATALITSLFTAAYVESLRPSEVMVAYGRSCCGVLALAMAAKLLVEASVFRHLRDKQASGLRRSAVLMTGDLAAATKSRFICGFLGGIALPGMLVHAASSSPSEAGSGFICLVAIAMFIACLAGELLERYLFFAAVAPPKMPGGVC